MEMFSDERLFTDWEKAEVAHFSRYDMKRGESMTLDLAMQVTLTFAAFVIVSIAFSTGSRLDATWLTAAASFGTFVTTFYIAFYLWKVSRWLQRMCEMLVNDAGGSS